jgi:hypothetical protein
MKTKTPWTHSEVIGSHQRKWSVDAEGYDEHIATLWGNGHDAKANASFIVMAVNCHEDLLRQVIIWHYGPAHDQWESDCVCCQLIERAGGRAKVIDYACKATDVA